MGPADVRVNRGKVLARRCVEIGMIEIEIQEYEADDGVWCSEAFLTADSAALLMAAKDAYDIYTARSDLEEKKAALDKASKRLVTAMQRHTSTTPTDLDGLWKLVRRMRENRGAPPPTIACGDDLNGTIMDLLRHEIAQFDAALQEAKAKLAGGANPDTGGTQT